METEKTATFDNDIKKLTAKDKERLERIIYEITNSKKRGKQLHHLKDTFTIRIENKRLVYQTFEKENKLLLLMFKSRDDVYEYLK